MDYAYWRLLSKDFEPDNRPVHFRSSGVLLLNLARLKYENNVHNRLSAYDNKTYLFIQDIKMTDLTKFTGVRINKPR